MFFLFSYLFHFQDGRIRLLCHRWEPLECVRVPVRGLFVSPAAVKGVAVLQQLVQEDQTEKIIERIKLSEKVLCV